MISDVENAKKTPINLNVKYVTLHVARKVNGNDITSLVNM